MHDFVIQSKFGCKAFRAASLTALLGLCLTANAESPPRPTSLAVWRARLVRIASSLPKAETSAASITVTEELRSEFADACTGLRVRTSARVADVRWKDGVATIETERDPPYRGPRRPAWVWKASRVDVLMSEEEASAIRPRSRLAVDGILTFHVGHLAGFGDSRVGQLLFYVRGPAGWSGYCTTFDYRVKLAGKDLQPRWADADGLIVNPDVAN